MSARRSLLLPALSLLLGGCSVTADQPPPAGSPLDGEAITTLFSNHTFLLTGMKSGNRLVVHADAEHCTMRYVEGKRTRTVRWYVEGDQHCCIKQGEAICGEIRAMGGGVYHKVTGGRHSHTMEGFVAGDRFWSYPAQ